MFVDTTPFEYNAIRDSNNGDDAMSESITSRAKSIYEQKRVQFEKENPGQFVAIEPDSGDLFLADSFDAAVAKAVARHPHKISHTIRIGQEAAFHIGLMTR